MFPNYDVVVRTVVDSLYPHRCPVCETVTASWRYAPVCRECWDSLLLSPPWCCERCGRPLHSLKSSWTAAAKYVQKVNPTHTWICPDCDEISFSCSQIRSALLYMRQGTTRSVILALKHSRRISLIPPLAHLMSQQFQRLMNFHPNELVVPVPLHRNRLLFRGFNQSLLLGREFARLVGLPVSNRILARVVNTPPQTGNPKRRAKNVSNVFVVRNPKRVEGRRVLLIDDVMTTGATLEECAMTLILAGCSSVRAMTLARVP